MSVCLSIPLSICLFVILSCLLHISWTLWKIFMKPLSNVCRSEMMCRTYNSTMLTQGQGHNWRSQVWPFISHPLHISLYPLNDFHFTLVKCLPKWDHVQNPLLNHADSRSRSQLKVMGLILLFCVHSISSFPLEGFSLNFGQIFSAVRQCAEPITQLCRLKVKVTNWRLWVWAFNFISALYLLFPWKDFH